MGGLERRRPARGARAIVFQGWLALAFLLRAGESNAAQAAGDSFRLAPFELSLAVGDGSDTEIVPGTPLVLTVSLMDVAALRKTRGGLDRRALDEVLRLAAEGNEPGREVLEALEGKAVAPAAPLPVALEPARISFRLEDAKGASLAPWPAIPVEVPADQREAGALQEVVARFVVAPAAMARVVPGTYTLVAAYEHAPNDPSAWRGRVESDPATVTVVLESGDSGRRMRKQLALAEYALVVKDHGTAEKAVGEILAIAPRYIEGFVLKGKLQEARGQYQEALDAYGDAFHEYRQVYRDASPPREIVRAIRRMWAKLGFKLPEVVR